MLENRILVKSYCRLKLDQKMLVDKINQELNRRGMGNAIELSVLLVGRKRGRELNVRYRKKNYDPQMLEFPMSKEKDEDGYVRLGDIVICLELLYKDTRIFGKNVEEVLTEWLIHGIDNLLQ